MTKREAQRQYQQEAVLLGLGFTNDEAESLRRISNRLRHWFERECGIDGGCIERDETTNKPYWLSSYTMKRHPIADLEAGAMKRLKAVIDARNMRQVREADNDPNFILSSYIQGDPRGAALYILRPGDVPEGKDVNSYYTRGICVY